MEWDFLKYFTDTNAPFLLLFVALFFYFIKTSKDREERQSNLIDVKLSKVEEELQVLIKVWKILLEKELEKK